MARNRTLALAAVTVAAMLLAAVTLWLGHRSSAVHPGPAAAPAPAPVPSRAARSAGDLPVGTIRGRESRPVRVLRAWDRRRARAYARGDASRLLRLYLAHSTAGAGDVALLRRYRARGLRVVGLRMQLLAVRAVRVSPRRMTLRVTDRVVGATAVGHRRRLRLPADRASSNVVSLRRTPAGRWQVAAVRALGD